MMKFGLKICAVLLLFAPVAEARIQPGDSLLNALAAVPAAEKIDYLLHVLEYTEELSNQDAIDYANDGLEWAMKYDTPKGQARLLNYLGNCYYKQGSLDMALNYYQQTLHIAMSLDDKEEMANLMQKMGMVHFNMNDRKRALLYFQQTLKIYQALDYPNREAEMYTHVGSIYYYWNDFTKATENYELALDIYTNLENNSARAHTLYLLGLCSYKQGKEKDAVHFFEKAIHEYKKIQNFSEIARVNNAIGDVYMLSNKLDKALIYYEKAYTIDFQTHNEMVMAQALNNLGNVHKELGNFTRAKGYIDESMEITERLGLSLTKIDNLRVYYEIYYLQDEAKQALTYYQQYIALKDSLLIENEHLGDDVAKVINDDATLALKKEILQREQANKRIMHISMAIIFVLLLLSINLYSRLKTRELEAKKGD